MLRKTVHRLSSLLAVLSALALVACGGGGGGQNDGGHSTPRNAGAVVGQIEVNSDIPLVRTGSGFSTPQPGRDLFSFLELGPEPPLESVTPQQTLNLPLSGNEQVTEVLGASIIEPGEEVNGINPPEIRRSYRPLSLTGEGEFAFTGIPAGADREYLLNISFFSVQEGDSGLSPVPVRQTVPIEVRRGEVTRVDVSVDPSESGQQNGVPSELNVERGFSFAPLDSAQIPQPAPTGDPRRDIPPQLAAVLQGPADNVTRESLRVDLRRGNVTFGSVAGSPGGPQRLPDANGDGYPGFLFGTVEEVRDAALVLAMPGEESVTVQVRPGETRLGGIELNRIQTGQRLELLVRFREGELIAQLIRRFDAGERGFNPFTGSDPRREFFGPPGLHFPGPFPPPFFPGH